MRSPVKPWIDPTVWRDELDDLRHMLAEAGRDGPLRGEVALLLAQAGRADRITSALLAASRAETGKAEIAAEDGLFDGDLTHRRRAATFTEAATISEATR